MRKGSLKRSIFALAATAALLTGSVATATQAVATPTGCYAYFSVNGGYARCSGGTGYVRVLVACGSPSNIVFGPWVTPNRNSIVFCSGPLSVSYQTSG